ncbi:MAG: hypothetical protein M9918_18415 [Anaerolineae bacterium]|nr:hypothetical protein [Anaerolineae bacterium]MCO5190150.1 hypothetical protein [Anaerolineae bacterium]MCO5192873.1 hypothetical protein [Anaerolineae bacterium]
MSEDTKPEITEMDVAEVLVEEGAVEMIDGSLKLDEALDVAAASRQAGEAAVADAVLAEAAMIGAGRSMALSDAVGEAGIEDIEEGAAMLDAADSLAVIGAVIDSMNEDDLAHSMEIAAISGQLNATGDLMSSIDMPVMAAFLWDRGDRLRELAVDSMVRFALGRTLSEAIAETESEIEALGENELAEGLARLDLSDEFAEEAVVMASVSLAAAQASAAEATAAEDMREFALDEAGEAISEMVEGAAEITAGEMLAEDAEADE